MLAAAPQRVQLVFGTSDTTVTASLGSAVPQDRFFPRRVGSNSTVSYTVDLSETHVLITWDDANTIRGTRIGTGSALTVDVLVHHTSDTVRWGDLDLSAAQTQNTATLSPTVDWQDCRLEYSHNVDGTASGSFASSFCTHELNSGGAEVDVRRNTAAGVITGRWYLVESTAISTAWIIQLPSGWWGWNEACPTIDVTTSWIGTSYHTPYSSALPAFYLSGTEPSTTARRHTANVTACGWYGIPAGATGTARAVIQVTTVSTGAGSKAEHWDRLGQAAGWTFDTVGTFSSSAFASPSAPMLHDAPGDLLSCSLDGSNDIVIVGPTTDAMWSGAIVELPEVTGGSTGQQDSPIAVTTTTSDATLDVTAPLDTSVTATSAQDATTDVTAPAGGPIDATTATLGATTDVTVPTTTSGTTATTANVGQHVTAPATLSEAMTTTLGAVVDVTAPTGRVTVTTTTVDATASAGGTTGVQDAPIEVDTSTLDATTSVSVPALASDVDASTLGSVQDVNAPTSSSDVAITTADASALVGVVGQQDAPIDVGVSTLDAAVDVTAPLGQVSVGTSTAGASTDVTAPAGQVTATTTVADASGSSGGTTAPQDAPVDVVVTTSGAGATVTAPAGTSVVDVATVDATQHATAPTGVVDVAIETNGARSGMSAAAGPVDVDVSTLDAGIDAIVPTSSSAANTTVANAIVDVVTPAGPSAATTTTVDAVVLPLIPDLVPPYATARISSSAASTTRLTDASASTTRLHAS